MEDFHWMIINLAGRLEISETDLAPDKLKARRKTGKTPVLVYNISPSW